MTRTTIAASLGLLCLSAASVAAQAFGPGPPGTPVGSSMSGARIVGAPSRPRGRPIPNADVFGDEAEERAFGKDYDDSHLTPEIPVLRRQRSNEERASEGRADLNPVNAGDFARRGPRAIGGSAVTRPQAIGRRDGRARIVLPDEDAKARGGR